MTGPWRPLALAAALTVTLGAGVANAQAVMVRNAPPGMTVELVLNAATVDSAAADAAGIAKLAVKEPAKPQKPQSAAHIHVDVCEKRRRVVLVEPGVPPPAPPAGEGCERKDIAGLFVMRPVTTFVIDLAVPGPTVWLRQGPVPPTWLTEEAGIRGPRFGRSAPTRLALFGGAGGVKFRDAVSEDCGTVSPCTGTSFRGAYSVGVDYWVAPFLAADFSYTRTGKVNVNGSGDTFHFTSNRDAHIIAIAGKAAIPLGPVRIYFLGGVNYHRVTSTTTETIDDISVTNGDVTQAVPGGTQSFELQADGWGWLFGGGVEAWVTPRFAVYAEGGAAGLNSSAINATEGVLDDQVTFVAAGLRMHIGRRPRK